MKTSLIALIALFSFSAYGASTPTVTATNTEGFFSGQNIVKNAGFEMGGTTPPFWTASGGSLSVTSTAANVARGSYALSWDSNGAGQTVTGTAITVPAGLKGRSGVFSCQAMCASGTCTHTLGLWDGSAETGTTAIHSSTAIHHTVSSNFVFPTSGTLALRLRSLASNEPIVYIDNCSIGMAEGVNLMTIQPGETLFAGVRYRTNASCAWSNNGSPYTEFAHDADCSVQDVYGHASIAAGNFQPEINVSDMPLGYYRVVVPTTGFIGADTGACTYALTDGTDYSGHAGVTRDAAVSAQTARTGIVGIFPYTSGAAPSTKKFQLLSQLDVGTATCSIQPGSAAQGNAPFEMYVYYTPLDSETIHRAELYNAYGATVWTGTAGLTCTVTAGSFTACNDSGFDAARTNYGAATAQSTGDDMALKIPQLPEGDYLVEFHGQMQADFSAAQTTCTFAISDGTTTQGPATASSAVANTLDNVASTKAIFSYTSKADRTFTLQVKRQAGSGNCTVNLAATGQNTILTVTPLKERRPAVQYIGSVTSASTTSAERIERARITNSGSCVVSAQSGTWISGTGDPGLGECSLTFASIWSNNPSCTCSVVGNSAHSICHFSSAPAVGGAVVKTLEFTSLSSPTHPIVAPADLNFDIICMGQSR